MNKILKKVRVINRGFESLTFRKKKRQFVALPFFVCRNPVTACGHKDEGMQKERYCAAMPFSCKDARGSARNLQSLTGFFVFIGTETGQSPAERWQMLCKE